LGQFKIKELRSEKFTMKCMRKNKIMMMMIVYLYSQSILTILKVEKRRETNFYLKMMENAIEKILFMMQKFLVIQIIIFYCGILREYEVKGENIATFFYIKVKK